MNHAIIALLVWNLCVFFVYAMDKHRAKRRLWRISERKLLVCALLGGGFGALAGMYGLRHKTRRIKFRILVPASAVFTAVLICFLLLR